jgi:hypothetical protein
MELEFDVLIVVKKLVKYVIHLSKKIKIKIKIFLFTQDTQTINNQLLVLRGLT